MSVARPDLLTPLHAVLKGHGAQFSQSAGGWLVASVYTDQQSEVSAARQRLAIADDSTKGNVRVEGAEAEAVLQAVYGLGTVAIGESAAAASGRCYRLRDDLFCVITPAGAEDVAADAIVAAGEAAGHGVTVTIVTHGQASIRIIGPRVTELMSKLCGLDFSSAAFSDGTAQRTSFAKTAQLVIRHDIGQLPAFLVVGARSGAAYVWETILESGEEYGITPIGQTALEMIIKESNERGT